jgi:hypothetical protein
LRRTSLLGFRVFCTTKGDELIQQINRLKNETEEENQLVQKRQQELDRAYKFFLINYFSLSKLDLILQVLNSTYQDYKKLKMSYTKLAPYVPLLKVSQENKHTYQSQAWDLPENFGNEWESKLGNNGLYVTKQIANSYLVSIFSALYLGRLVLLNGTVGVGKTSIIKHSATILGGKSNIIPVRPAWLDPTDLLGFYDPLQEIFRPAPFLSSLNEARKTENILHLICLDELNLAKIENYAADVLSQLEYSRTNKDNDSGLILYSQDLWENLRNECKYLYEKKENLDFKNQQRLKILRNLFYNYPSYQFTIPRNLVLLGTLNSDETTYDLSPKLIDRSFIITYPPASLDNLTFATPQQPSQDSQSVEHQYLSTQSIIDKINNTQEEVFKKEQALANWKKLLSWNQEYFCKYQLGRPLGYRLGKDYQVFTTVALSLGFSEEESFAYFIFTKILPRIYFFKEDEKSNQFQSWFKELEIYRDYDLGNILDNLQKQLENQQIQLVRYGG